MSEEIVINLDKLIDNYKFNEEIIEKLYDNDYKKVALDLAKQNQKFSFEILHLQNIIKEVREYIESKVVSSNEVIDGLRKSEVRELLEILDKGSDKK